MKKKKLYSVLSAATSLVGIGMLLGYSLANGTSKNPLWIGGVLILLGAITFGMTISSREVTELIEDSKK
jgi:hypothetical protein